MPLSRKRKKKGQRGFPTPPRAPRFQTSLPQLLATSNELDRMEEELLIKEIEKMEEETPDAPE